MQSSPAEGEMGTLAARLEPAAGPFSIARALADIRDGLLQWRLWSALAWEDVKTTHRRTTLGVAWYIVTFGLFVAAKLIVFGSMTTQSFSYFALYLVVGFLVWELLASLIIDGTNVFISASAWISGVRLPLSLFVYRSIQRTLIAFLYRLPVVAAVFIFCRHAPTLAALAALPALVLILASALWVQLLLGCISARFRDMQHLIQTGVRIVFFVSPIVWTLDQLGRFGAFLYWNPFYHYIAIVRAPLIDGVVPLDSWLYVLVMTAVGSAVALAVFARCRSRIVFWL